jgi:hypothetical protein
MEGRSIGQRTAALAFAAGGLAFVLFVAGFAVAHFVYGMTINDEAGVPLAQRDLLLFFSIAPVLGAIVSARGFWMLRRLKQGTAH